MMWYCRSSCSPISSAYHVHPLGARVLGKNLTDFNEPISIYDID
jgi:hypothetical protein